MDFQSSKVMWAKMPGFPLWPGRRCSVFEEMDLEKLVLRKPNQVGIVFFEKKPKKAWMCEDSLQKFTLDAPMKESKTSAFRRKLFESNLNYRQAVVEAVRIVRAEQKSLSTNDNSCKDDTPFVQLTNKYNKNSEGNCELCGGSSYSGELRQCCSVDTNSGRCGGVHQVHYHCFEKDAMVLQLEDRWYCLSCSQSYGWTNSVLLPEDPSLVPFFGTVDKYLAPSRAGQGDQLYHVLFEDGDGEEYFPDELAEVMATYDSFHGDSHNQSFRAQLVAPMGSTESAQESDWTADHPSVGIRVCKYFDGVLPTECRPIERASAPAGLASPGQAKVSQAVPSSATTSTSSITAVAVSEPSPLSEVKSKHPPPRRSIIALPDESTHTVAKPADGQSSRGQHSQQGRSPRAALSRSERWEAYLQTQAAVKRKLLSSSNLGASSGPSALPAATSNVLESAAIKKRARVLEEDSPVKDSVDMPTSSSPHSESRPTPSSQHSESRATSSPAAVAPRKRSCQHPENAQIITFFDECLTVMARHREHMERARERALLSRDTVSQTFAHQIVENLAGDLINTINHTLKDIPSSSKAL